MTRPIILICPGRFSLADAAKLRLLIEQLNCFLAIAHPSELPSRCRCPYFTALPSSHEGVEAQYFKTRFILKLTLV